MPSSLRFEVLAMAFATCTQLEANAQRLTESLRKAASVLSSASNLFLSHSGRDKGDLLNGAIAVLHENGASVYADILDPEAKQLSPNKFGVFFSQAISDTERLVALVTSQTSTSRWVPWELGLAHGIHSATRVAVWPVKSLGESETWAR